MNAAAPQIRAHLLKVERDGRIEAAWVVKDARSPKSPLHSEFEWDDAKEAHKSRLTRAREIIRLYYVPTPPEEPEAKPIKLIRTRDYIPDPTPMAVVGYTAIRIVRSNAGMTRQAVVAEVERTRGAVQRTMQIANQLGAGALGRNLLRRMVRDETTK